MKKTNLKKISLKFTGERFIPELNVGAAFFYEHLARYLFTSQLVKNKVVLDAGCGSGYGSYILSKYGYAKKVFGIDISKEAVEYARLKYKFKNTIFKVDSVEELASINDKSIDIAASFEVIEHIENQNIFLKQIIRVLKVNGFFIVSTPNKYTYPPGNNFHVKELYPKEFLKLLKKYFKNVKIFNQGFSLSQSIEEESKEKITLEESFNIKSKTSYFKDTNIKESQYLLAVCSDNDIPDIGLIEINLKKADEFDFSKGILSLGEQFNSLKNKVSTLQQNYDKISQDYQNQEEFFQKESKLNRLFLNKKEEKIIQLEESLAKIQSSNFYKVWQKYCQFRDKLFRNLKK